MTVDENFLSVDEVAQLLNKTPRTIRRWVRDGEFPGAYKDGPKQTSRYLIPETAVVAIQQRIKSGTINPKKD